MLLSRHGYRMQQWRFVTDLFERDVVRRVVLDEEEDESDDDDDLGADAGGQGYEGKPAGLAIEGDGDDDDLSN